MPGKSPIERRAERLAQRMERRTSALVTRLTEPAPPFKTRINDEDQLRKYLDLRESGGLKGLRESFGGPHADADVDRYVARMERLLAEKAPHMVIRSFSEPPELNANPFGFHEGLVAALGLDGEAPSVERARAEMGEDERVVPES